MVSINVVGIRLYFVAYNIHILSTDLLSANLRFFLKTATNLLLYMRTLKRYSDLCVLFLFSSTPINFPQANYLTFGNHSISVIQTKHHIQNICMLQIYYRQFIVRPSCRYSQVKA